MIGRAAAVSLVLAAPAGALELTDHERAAFGAEIRALLLQEPEIVGAALAPAPGYLDENIARDRATLDTLAPRLFTARCDGTPVAFFAAPDCAECAATRALLRDLGACISDHSADGALARELGLDLAPSFVLRDRMVRGAVPPVVIERYLATAPE